MKFQNRTKVAFQKALQNKLKQYGHVTKPETKQSNRQGSSSGKPKRKLADNLALAFRKKLGLAEAKQPTRQGLRISVDLVKPKENKEGASPNLKN